MGLYDRDYYRGDRRSFSLPGPRTAVGWLILINVVVYVADWLRGPGEITSLLAVYGETLTHPLYWWQFLTYGFAHSSEPGHILFNMLSLWFLGRDVEAAYGPREFLRFYLTALVVGSVAWAAANRLGGVVHTGPLIGASGAVVAVVILFALNFPHRTLLLFFVLPVPAWFVGVLLVAFDAYTALQGNTHIAWGVHMAGAAFALAYFRFGWNLGRVFPSRLSWDWLKPRRRFEVFNPDETEEDDGKLREDDRKLREEVDRILGKISRQGEGSLSRQERRTLQDASREYQRRRQEAGDKR